MNKVKCLFGFHSYTLPNLVPDRPEIKVCKHCFIAGYRKDKYGETEFWYRRDHSEDDHWVWTRYKCHKEI